MNNIININQISSETRNRYNKINVSPPNMNSPKKIHQEPKNGKYIMKHLDTI